MNAKGSILFVYASTLFCFLGLTQLPIQAQNQQQILEQEKGTVFGGNPAVYTFTAKVTPLKISVRKTEGRAKAEINIYIDGRLQSKHTLRFPEGQGLAKKTTKLTLKAGQKIKIEVVNQSVGKKFQYEVLVYQ